jgi:hypothetical protein
VKECLPRMHKALVLWFGYKVFLPKGHVLKAWSPAGAATEVTGL